MPEIRLSKFTADHLRSARRMVVLTGAGVSAESGIPTFRGDGSHWHGMTSEELATREAFARSPKLVWEWYMWRRELTGQAAPNSGHFALKEWEQLVPGFTLITQNVDGLHQRAGSVRVLELHGDIMRSRCDDCGLDALGAGLDEDGQLPSCRCGGLIRPDVVWFGELLPAKALESAWDSVARADVFVSIGTSSIVFPAAGLATAARAAGSFLIEVNPEPTQQSDIYDEVIRGAAASVLPLMTQYLTHISDSSTMRAAAC